MRNYFKKYSVLLFAILMFIPINIFANSDIKLWIDGNYVTSDVSPVIENDRKIEKSIFGRLFIQRYLYDCNCGRE